MLTDAQCVSAEETKHLYRYHQDPEQELLTIYTGGHGNHLPDHTSLTLQSISSVADRTVEADSVSAQGVTLASACKV